MRTAAQIASQKMEASRVRSPGKQHVLRRYLGLAVLLAFLGGLGALAVIGFMEGREEAAVESERGEPIKPPLRVTLPARGQPIVTIDADSQRAIGLETIEPRSAPYQEQIRAFGTVLDLAQLTTLNTSYVEAVSQLRTARAKVAASLPAYERARNLYAKDIGNLVQVQTTEAALIGDKAGVEAAESRVRTLRATAIQEWGPVIGLALENSAGLVHRLIEREEFLLQITVPPGKALDPPATAAVEVPGSARRAEVRYISPATRTDPKIQGLSFFYAAAANSGVLPGMNARAFLVSGQPVDGYVIPPSAIVWWAGRPWVYVKIGDDEFTRREIPTDMPVGRDGEFVVPVSAFDERGPAIVLKGAQMLLSEEFRAQIQVEGDDD
jgi:hypothetical protein